MYHSTSFPGNANVYPATPIRYPPRVPQPPLPTPSFSGTTSYPHPPFSGTTSYPPPFVPTVTMNTTLDSTINPLTYGTPIEGSRLLNKTGVSSEHQDCYNVINGLERELQSRHWQAKEMHTELLARQKRILELESLLGNKGYSHLCNAPRPLFQVKNQIPYQHTPVLDRNLFQVQNQIPYQHTPVLNRSGDFQEKAIKAIPATVHMFSGCRDDQTSADVGNTASFGVLGPDGAGGACTNSLLSVVYKTPNITWVELLEGMRVVLKQKGYKQVPELSSSRPIQLTTNFKISTGTGRHRALLVGINYVGQTSALSGCVNDVKKMKQYLQSNGYSEFRVLADADNVGDDLPTKSNILAGFDWLVSGANPGDNLFFHYSGHGSQTADINGDEGEGKDETIVPSDYTRAGQIVDDEIFKKLVLPLPENCQLSVVMDCCHSGTVLDLPYVFKADNSHMQPIYPNGLAGGMNISNVPVMEQNPLFKFEKLMALMKKFYQDIQSGNYMGVVQGASNMYNAYNNMTGSVGSGGNNMIQQFASGFSGGGWW